MLRVLYRAVLRLHPPAFRRRFGDEMLSIFDHARGTPPAFGLFLDSILSLTRQWALRPEFWYEVAPAPEARTVSDGIPLFSTLDPFRPRASAVVPGLVLSIAVFCLTCFAIRYSWIRVLHVHIPEVQFEVPQWTPQRTTPNESRRTPAEPLTEKQVPALPAATPRAPAAEAHASTTVQALAPGPKAAANATAQPSAAARGESLEAAQASARVFTMTTLPQALLESYPGTYGTRPPGRLTISITIDAGHLMMKATGQPRRMLLPVSESKFVVRGMENCFIEFTTGGDGTSRELQWIQDGRQFTLYPIAPDRIDPRI